MKILFLHGLDSKPYQDRIAILSKYGEVDMPFIDYRKMNDTFAKMEKHVKSFSPDIIVGHSMGGLLAYHLCNKYKVKCLMFMPAFFSSNAKFLCIPKDEDGLYGQHDDMLAVIGSHDDAVDNEATKRVLPADKIEVIDSGHKLAPTVLEYWFKKFNDLNLVMKLEGRNMVTSIREFQQNFFKIGNITKDIQVDIEIEHGVHSLERQRRHDSVDGFISNADIKAVINAGSEQFVDCLIENKLNINDAVLITRKSDNLNVVGSIGLKNNNILFKVITVMRTPDFRNKHKTYQIFV